MFCVRCGLKLTDKNIDHKARVPYRYEMCKWCYPNFTKRLFFNVLPLYLLLVGFAVYVLYININAIQGFIQ